ncbi:PQQ-dependent sugar dehydrogenase [Halococcus thailandensis]|uniref:Blue copper domain protein n=1 Tax=Halococcus thailandensis JCM 13552 TaxID=1227457 RepID=M0MZ26_9EURY|nr:PQQ-dependent sugar dehydrogenase [Halococcus thailandensis]EMA49665.1 blue copper domain protein [Halococcus thailandensis JCM 13552]
MNPIQHTQDDGSRAVASRRRFLSLMAAGALAGVATAGRGRAQSSRTIELGGKIAGWQGRAPDSIADEENPTLALEVGVDYRITWTNLDGMGHNIALVDENDAVLERTEVMSEQGATQTIEFTAREEMAEYICEPHRSSMRGSVRFGSGSSVTTDAATTEQAVPTGPTIGLERLVGGFQVPTDMALLPGDDQRVVVDLYGVAQLNEGDQLRDEPFLDLRDRLAEITGERGFLGLAPHPDYEENRRFYVRYSAPPADDAPDEFSHTEILSEFEANEDGTSARPDSERVLLEVHEPRKVHNGGAVAFGPDGYLYASYGDGGGPRDTGPGHASDWYDRNRGGNGQDVTENLRGSILRIDVDSQEGDKPYAIPDDNPLVGENGLDEHYAWGFRNPWRMSFNDGELYVADVGQNRYEEIDRVVKGGNYGWNVREGTHCYGTESLSDMPKNCPSRTPPDVRGGEPLRDPVIEYPHARNGETIGISVIGGYLYDGSIDALDGKYVFGDYSKEGDPRGSLFAATPTENGLWDLERLQVAGAEGGAVEGYLIAIARDADGELFALTSAGELGGAVNRITATEATGTATTPDGTNATGSATSALGTDTADTDATDTDANATAGVRSAAGNSTASGSDGMNGSDGTNGSGNASGTETSGDGAGFGVLAALAGIGGLAARRLRR